MQIITKTTSVYEGQKFGTSGLRKTVKDFQQPNYLENFLTAIFTSLDINNKIVVLGGDGRFFNKSAINIALKILIALGAKKVYVGQNGFFSTPAISHFIRKYKLDYGVIFSASHNPAGKTGDFGVKVNGNNGSGISESLCETIYQKTLNLKEFITLDQLDFNIDNINQAKFFNTEVEVVDPVVDYSDYMQQIFDFPKIKQLITDGFTLNYEAFNAITGIYAKDIFINKLGVNKSCLFNIDPLEDFGGNHADPNKIYARHLIDLSMSDKSPDILFASDGDGDRNMIVGKGISVSPSDSLAIILQYADLIPFYHNKVVGVARSMPTSGAVDLVAKKLKINSFAVPTGWKFFGNLLEKNKVTFCGEESYGTSSAHSGEKDGIWAMLFWLNIIAVTKKSVKELLEGLWQTYGRFYFTRLDYEDINKDLAINIINAVNNLNNQKYNNELISLSNFNYVDPVTHEIANNKGLIIAVGSDTRIIIRESGTSTGNATLRIYIEKLEKEDIYLDSQDYLKPLINFVIDKICLNNFPTIID
ncbi:alpha-D-glucose phosphate-specific phosphoglucomutase [Rickettsiales bacterium LUAb2]